MSWILLGLMAGLILGTYDFFSKLALSETSVLGLVFWCSLFGAALWLPFLCLQPEYDSTLSKLGLTPAALSWEQQVQLLPKSIAMIATWILSYYAVKALSLSISAGVRASGPLWTTLGAMLLFSEQLNPWQWLGLTVSMIAYCLFAQIGKKEGIHFNKNRWVFCMLAATLLSSANALYDKHILANIKMDLAAVQAYSALQRGAIALFLLPWLLRKCDDLCVCFRHWSIPATACLYVVAEYVYLTSVQTEGALISVISVLRRTNLLMVFGLSALFFHEQQFRKKTVAIMGVFTGIALTVLH